MTNQPNPEVVARWCYKHGQWSHKCTGCELDKANELIAKLREELESWKRAAERKDYHLHQLQEAITHGASSGGDSQDEYLKALKAERDQQAARLREIREEIVRKLNYRFDCVCFEEVLDIIDREKQNEKEENEI